MNATAVRLLIFAIIVVAVVIIVIKKYKPTDTPCTVDNYIKEGLGAMTPDFGNNNTPVEYNGKCVAPYLNLPGDGTVSCDDTCKNDSTLKAYWGKSGICASTFADIGAGPITLACNEKAKDRYGAKATTLCGCKLSI